MEKALTTEDIIILLVMISVVYAMMTFLQNRFQAYLKAQTELQKWGLSLKLSDNQQKVLIDLWAAYKKRKLLDESIEQQISENELNELLELSSKDQLPDSLKKFYKHKKRERFKNKMLRVGYSNQQTVLLAGILYNKIGGIHAIKF